MVQSNFIIRPYKKGEEEYVAKAQERVYLEEYNWGPAFGDYAKKIAYDFAATPENPKEELWVAEMNGEFVGCIMLVESDNPEIGLLRLFLVEKKCRKNGVGSALTDTLIKKAYDCGYSKLILWTASTLTAARHHYFKMGFRCIESVPNDTWSLDGEKINEEKWEMQL